MHVQGGLGLSLSLGNLSCLKSLNLEGNGLGYEASMAIGLSLKPVTTLDSLDIEDNRVGESGGEAFEALLDGRNTLRYVPTLNPIT